MGAHLRIPFPLVPVTLQLAVVCLTGLWLGARAGAASQIVYLLVGLVGFPVFAKGGGPQYVLEPSFGYLLGFVPGAWIVGRLAATASGFRRSLLAVVAGIVTIYVVGVTGLWMSMRWVVGTDLSAMAILQLGVAPLPKDLLVGAAAAWAGPRLRAALPPA